MIVRASGEISQRQGRVRSSYVKHCRSGPRRLPSSGEKSTRLQKDLKTSYRVIAGFEFFDTAVLRRPEREWPGSI